MQRGKILRDTNAGPGLIFLDGKQLTFTLENHWKSADVPKSGATVEVELNQDGEISSVYLVDETQIAKEKAEKAFELAKEQSMKAAAIAGTHGKVYLDVFIQKFGLYNLIAIIGLVISWHFFTFVKIDGGFINLKLTFSEMLKYVNLATSDEPNFSVSNVKDLSSGIYGFLMYLVLIGTLAPTFLNHKYINLLYCGPVAYVTALVIGGYVQVSSKISDAKQAAVSLGGRSASRFAESILNDALEMILKSFKFGYGFYISMAFALFLFAIGLKKHFNK